MQLSSFLLGLALSTLSISLTGISACEPNIDTDEDGYTSDVDCDDMDDAVHPDAAEVCDATDNDCDGNVDEDLPTSPFYPDADMDGYGDADLPVQACRAPTGYLSNDPDCDDDDADFYPGAPDTLGNGLDSSCDGIDSNAPSVGLQTSLFASIQAALDAADAGQTVWVGPGTYPEYGLTFQGKGLCCPSSCSGDI